MANKRDKILSFSKLCHLWREAEHFRAHLCPHHQGNDVKVYC
jgi:hypothetical protein